MMAEAGIVSCPVLLRARFLRLVLKFWVSRRCDMNVMWQVAGAKIKFVCPWIFMDLGISKGPAYLEDPGVPIRAVSNPGALGRFRGEI